MKIYDLKTFSIESSYCGLVIVLQQLLVVLLSSFDKVFVVSVKKPTKYVFYFIFSQRRRQSLPRRYNYDIT